MMAANVSSVAAGHSRPLVYVTAALPTGHGEAFILAEAHELRLAGESVVLVPRSGELEIYHERARSLATEAIIQPLFSLNVGVGAVAEFLRQPIRAIGALQLLFRSRSLTIFAKNLAVWPKGLWLARNARQKDAYHIHAHWAGTSATMSMVASRVSGIPWSFTAHRWDIVENNLFATKVKHSRFVRFISQSGCRLAHDLGVMPRACLDKVRVVHMGVALPVANRVHPVASDITRILCPANLVPVKGHRILLEATAVLLQRGLNVHVQLAGKGELEDQLKSLVRDKGLEKHVEFLGQLPHEQLLSKYRQGKVDIVVLPSLDLGNGLHEGIPVSLIEAMAFAVPVVSTRAGGVPELVTAGAGLVVEPGDLRQLADAIEALARDPGARLSLGLAGRQRVYAEFDVVSTAARLRKLFREAMSSAPESFKESATGMGIDS